MVMYSSVVHRKVVNETFLSLQIFRDLVFGKVELLFYARLEKEKLFFIKLLSTYFILIIDQIL